MCRCHQTHTDFPSPGERKAKSEQRGRGARAFPSLRGAALPAQPVKRRPGSAAEPEHQARRGHDAEEDGWGRGHGPGCWLSGPGQRGRRARGEQRPAGPATGPLPRQVRAAPAPTAAELPEDNGAVLPSLHAVERDHRAIFQLTNGFLIDFFVSKKQDSGQFTCHKLLRLFFSSFHPSDSAHQEVRSRRPQP